MELNNFKGTKNPFLFFLPFLILYVALILIFASGVHHGDENRYFMYALNLTHGFYTLPSPFLDLGNGPGYPIVITPFVALKLPIISIKLMNALFYYVSIVFLFKSLQRIISFKFAIILSLIWAVYPNTFEQLPYTLPEVFASSLIPILLYLVTVAFNKEKSKKTRIYLVSSGLTFGYLALTKPIFGYVLIFMLLVTIFLLIIKGSNIHYKKTLIILMIGFVTTVPWLAYTYHMTGKLLYWSSYGGNNLYWMSSPYHNEYGDWRSSSFNKIDTINMIPGSAEQIKLNHQKDFEKIFQSKEAQNLYIKNGEIYGSPYTGVIQDDVLKKIAFQNIKTHPSKFLQNCLSNMGRMIFNYPASYTIQKPSTLKRLPINGIILVFSAFCFIVTLANWKKILFSLRFLLFFALIYFGGSILGSAEPRMFTMIVPILLYWIAYIFKRTVKIKLKFSLHE